MGYTPHVLVVGGGVVGTGIARDLAIRGLDVTLVERGTLAAGATGRSLGVLDSGARALESEQARRVHRESQVLRETAGHCIEDTGGVLVADDGPSLDDLRERLDEHSIPHELLEGDSVQEAEPGLAPDVDRAISVPDAVVDPSALAVATARSAREYGATIRPGTAVTDISVAGGTIDTVTVEHDAAGPGHPPASSSAETDNERPGVPGASSPPDRTDEPAKKDGDDQSGSTEVIDPDYVVNAAGGWAGEVAALAGLDLDLSPTAGVTVLLEESPVGSVVTRYESTPTAATVSPRGGQSVVGTAHEEISTPGEASIMRGRTERLLDRASEAVPGIGTARQLRWDVSVYAGPDSNPHEHALVDHGERDDCWGLTTVVGGSVTTHRHVAEQVADDVCAKFGIRRECQTGAVPLPGSGETRAEESRQSPMVCECRSVTRAEVGEAIADTTGEDTNLDEVRVRTGATMGACQGGKCAHRVADELYPDYDETVVDRAVDSFLAHHWPGQRHALVGTQLERAMRSYLLQTETLNLDRTGTTFVASKSQDVAETLGEDGDVAEDTVSLAAFDDGKRSRSRERPQWGERAP